MQDSQQGPGPTSRAHLAQQGDDDFEDWVSASADHLMRTALFLTGDLHLAEDLLQDSLERTYLHWRRVHEPAAYVRTVMVRALTDRWRRQHRRPREVRLADLDFDLGVGGHQPDTATHQAVHDEVVTALGQVSPRQCAVLVLRYYEDWTEAQIADALHCSTGTVKTQASRGLARLRQLLGPSHRDTPDPLDPTSPRSSATGGSPAPTVRPAPDLGGYPIPDPLTQERPR